MVIEAQDLLWLLLPLRRPPAGMPRTVTCAGDRPRKTAVFPRSTFAHQLLAE